MYSKTSPTAFLVGEHERGGEGTPPDAFRALRAGPRDGPYEQLERGRNGTAELFAEAVDVSGDVVAASLSTGQSTFVARVYLPGQVPRTLAPAARPAPTFRPTIRIAGRYVAYVDSRSQTFDRATVAVVDWTTGALAYRIDVPTPAPGRMGLVFDLQEDGTLAVQTRNAASTGGLPNSDVAWASIADPRLHVVGSAGPMALVRIANGTIVYGHRDGTLRASDLAGTTRGVSPPLAGYMWGLDFDGTQIAYAIGSCIYAGDLPATDVGVDPPPGACPQTLTQVFARGRWSQRRLPLTVACLQAPAAGCNGTVRLTARLRSGRRVTLARVAYAVEPSRSARLRLTVRKATLQRYRSRLRRRITGRVEIPDGSPFTTRLPGNLSWRRGRKRRGRRDLRARTADARGLAHPHRRGRQRRQRRRAGTPRGRHGPRRRRRRRPHRRLGAVRRARQRRPPSAPRRVWSPGRRRSSAACPVPASSRPGARRPRAGRPARQRLLLPPRSGSSGGFGAPDVGSGWRRRRGA